MMKKISLILMVIFATAVLFTSCKDKNEIAADIIPAKFKVDVPGSISNSTVKSDKNGILNGSDIYGNLTTFIAVGEGAADIVQAIMSAIREYDLDQAMSFSFQSDDDGRTKSVVIIENSEFEGQVWEYQLTLTDEDGGTGMQVFWNNSPVKGVSIINPYDLDRNSPDTWNDANTMYRVDYSEASSDYDAEMKVYITGLVLPADTIGDNKYAMETMKMFVGKKGDIVDVFGNSNHPNASFFDENTVGFNWAFAAAGDESNDRAVAEVGLPPSNLDETSRTVLLETYSIYNVFYNELMGAGYTDAEISDYIFNTQAPGYFNASGFVAAGTSPSTAYDAAEASMQNLTPYNPVLVSNLVIQFKDDSAS
ncbi:MAG: hypothetical protein L3J35_10510 [Bacteroidales bacterium]|nr:hypothetical protein [Bacteroidales bacterium]